jgi:toxin ParE1/3/4
VRVRYLRQARIDLADIAYYIALESRDAARRTVDLIRGRLKVLESFPGAGRPRDDLHPGLRSWPIDHCVLFYMSDESEIRIVRILHGARDVQRLFRQGE